MQGSLDIKIIEFEEKYLGIMEHKGPMYLLKHSLQRFLTWRNRKLLPPNKFKTYHLLYSDPLCLISQHHIGIGCDILEPVGPNSFGITERIIPNMQCAQVLCTGSKEQLTNIIHFVCHHWLPIQNRQLSAHPIFFEQMFLEVNSAHHQQQLKVYFPLK
ncbi:GyrI-like domain-containing protein [Thalassotalea aquiviva]|uniref:GyrI-like domain-containing protein n=1 Tax=Thalassotalea aquiviva TaxID=3242415 RepID=UPI00352A01AD